ncbi:hypothetical protein PAXINDRAFT_18793 [Paxillus involutus ATCC 200175]|uniref:Uncharacterized protein n=1 Tax=Paxillus involutus ATCC 200175 TaxID=664439 RepID=A0A0C9TJF5_PAXIN|nr:hypothetical protein PAXINDRAFT_18793 [Paxillus involutus ATCC 200175]
MANEARQTGFHLLGVKVSNLVHVSSTRSELGDVRISRLAPLGRGHRRLKSALDLLNQLPCPKRHRNTPGRRYPLCFSIVIADFQPDIPKIAVPWVEESDAHINSALCQWSVKPRVRRENATISTLVRTASRRAFPSGLSTGFFTLARQRDMSSSERHTNSKANKQACPWKAPFFLPFDIHFSSQDVSRAHRA